MKTKTKLNLNYGSIQAAYWMICSIVISFASAFLLDRGYSSTVIGFVFAVGNILAIIIQPLAAEITDKSKKICASDVIIFLASISVASMAVIVAVPKSSILVAILFSVLIALFFSMQSFISAVWFYLEETGYRINFGVCRAAGSLSYALLCTVMGLVIKKYGSDTILWGGIVASGVVIVTAAVSKVLHKKHLSKGDEHKVVFADNEKAVSARAFLKKYKLFTILMFGIACIFFAHNALGNFYLQVIMPIGGDESDLGFLLGFTALLELPAMIFYDKLSKKFGSGKLLIVSAVFFVVKTALIAVAQNMAFMYFAHVFQLASFALYSPAIVKYVNETIPDEDAVKGQAFAAAMITVGSIFVSVTGGYIIDTFGARTLMSISTAVVAIGLFAIVIAVKELKTADYKNK